VREGVRLVTLNAIQRPGPTREAARRRILKQVRHDDCGGHPNRVMAPVDCLRRMFMLCSNAGDR